MRIAYFTDTYLPQINGVTNTLDKLRNYLAANNIRHMFFAPHYPGDSKAPGREYVKRFKSVNFPVYPECRLSLPLYSNFSQLADKFKPDIVHLVTPLGIGLSGLRYARERGIPIVSSFHTNFDVYLKYYNLQCFEPLLWNFFKWFHKFCSINFCPSLDTMETLQSKGIENLKIWSRGIDTEAFNSIHRDPGIRARINPKGKKTFLYVGRLAAEKDLDILMSSIRNINTVHPGMAQFVIVGDGPYASYMKETSPDNVVFTGYLKGQALSEMYASCDVFVFPSSTETFGNVVLEAMASGLPVVAVNSGGVKDSIIHGYNGLLCKSRDVGSFTDSISRFIDDGSLISRMGTNARQYTFSKSWNKIFSQLVSDYHTVVEKTHKVLSRTA